MIAEWRYGSAYYSCVPLRYKISFQRGKDEVVNCKANTCRINNPKERLYIFFLLLFIWGFTSLSTLYRSYHDG